MEPLWVSLTARHYEGWQKKIREKKRIIVGANTPADVSDLLICSPRSLANVLTPGSCMCLGQARQVNPALSALVPAAVVQQRA
jgi:hypothetical protein